MWSQHRIFGTQNVCLPQQRLVMTTHSNTLSLSLQVAVQVLQTIKDLQRQKRLFTCLAHFQTDSTATTTTTTTTTTMPA